MSCGGAGIDGGCCCVSVEYGVNGTHTGHMPLCLLIAPGLLQLAQMPLVVFTAICGCAGGGGMAVLVMGAAGGCGGGTFIMTLAGAGCLSRMSVDGHGLTCRMGASGFGAIYDGVYEPVLVQMAPGLHHGLPKSIGGMSVLGVLMMLTK